MDMDFQKTAMKVSYISLAVNVLLAGFKLIAGIAADSGAMISDAVHSASDVFSTIVVMIGIKISCKASDKEHPYGHERMECVAAIILATILCITGLGIGKGAVVQIRAGSQAGTAVPGILAAIAAAVSIIVKEGMFWFTRNYAKKIDSGALMADAWHHRTDALSSIGALVGILFARNGFPVMDAVASLIICVFVIKAAFDIFKDAVDKMVDKACSPELEAEMKKLVLSKDGVIQIDLLRTRVFGNKVYVEIEISADGKKTLNETHDIAEIVHESIEREFPKVKHITVHVNPAHGNQSQKEIQ